MALHPSISHSSRRITASRRAAVSLALRLLYIVGVTAVLYLWLGAWGYDDPYITYRYAQNLADSSGFVYNLGERVQSTTTPLFALLLAAFSFLPVDLPRLANLTGAFSIAMGAYCLYELARAWETPLAGWAGLALYPFFPLLLTTIGSETPLYLALCSASFLFYARRSYRLTAVCSALAVLARPDGILVPALIGLHFLFNLLRERSSHKIPALVRKIPWQAGLIFVTLLLGWFFYAWAYFGSPLPVTLAAKQSQGMMVISQRFAAGFIDVVRDHAAQREYLVLGALAALGAVYAVVRARAWGLYLGWTVAYFAAYSILGVSRYYWYYAPLVPGFVVLAGLGLEGAAHGLRSLSAYLPERIQAKRGMHPSRLPARIHVLLLALTLVLAALLALSARGLGQNVDPRLEVYRVTGTWLHENTPPTARVGALEIGVMGYYARRTIIDFAGLLQPETARQLRLSNTYDDAARWAFERYRPNYIVVQQNSLPGLEADLQTQGCMVEASFPAPEFGTRQPLLVYACQMIR